MGLGMFVRSLPAFFKEGQQALCEGGFDILALRRYRVALCRKPDVFLVNGGSEDF